MSDDLSDLERRFQEIQRVAGETAELFTGWIRQASKEAGDHLAGEAESEDRMDSSERGWSLLAQGAEAMAEGLRLVAVDLADRMHTATSAMEE